MNLADDPGLDTPAPAVGALAGLRGAMQRQQRYLLTRLGLPGVAAIGLLTACAGFYVSVLAPLDSKIDKVTASVRDLSERVDQAANGTRGGTLSVADQLVEFYRLFPQQGELTDTLGKVFDTAQTQGLALQQGEYQVSADKAGKLQRFQILLPVKADYPRIRRFLVSLAAAVPTAALEHIQLERQKIGDTQVEATIKLAIYLEQ
jgi:hypothetical protein